jgi:rhamnogalacturonan endolyase
MKNSSEKVHVMMFNSRRYLMIGLLAVVGVTGSVGMMATAAGEDLDRGLVAMRRADGSVYVGWRLLESDSAETTFHVWRRAGGEGPRRLTTTPLADSTNFVDHAPPSEVWPYYSVTSASRGDESQRSREVRCVEAVAGASYLSIPLRGDYGFQKVAFGDLTGDGRYDYVIKQPDFNTDPFQNERYWKRSEVTYKLEAYSHDGDFLWSHDMGWSIEAGTWYSPYVVYDLDGDGRAEVYCKGGEGDPREPTGHVVTGPEWLYKLDGRTGRIIARIPWIEPFPEIGPTPVRLLGGGDELYPNPSRFQRNLLAIAFLDGRSPHLVMQRGTYQGIVLEAYDQRLEQVWQWKSWEEQHGDRLHKPTRADFDDPRRTYNGQGAHTLHAADITGDGRDEIIVGACVVGSDGKGLWTLGLGHPDVCHVGDIDPARPGLEIFYGMETAQPRGGVRLVEAATGKTLWSIDEPSRHIHGRGMVADLIAAHPGQEVYAGEQDGSRHYLFHATGEQIGDQRLGGLSPWTLWWSGSRQKEILLGETIHEFQGAAWQTIEGRVVAVADVLGDWREELIVSVPGELRIYTTTIPAPIRRICLMQDRLYRLGVATSSMGYHNPPQHSKPRAW